MSLKRLAQAQPPRTAQTGTRSRTYSPQCRSGSLPEQVPTPAPRHGSGKRPTGNRTNIPDDVLDSMPAAKIIVLRTFLDADPRSIVTGVMDRLRLQTLFPALREYSKSSISAAQRIRPLYSEYISYVSDEAVAASFELSCFLLVWCMSAKPKRILDFGSGFTSVVLRLYASGCGETVPFIESVDDSPAWLARSKSFVAAHNLQIAGVFTELRDFELQNTSQFDWVVHDLGTMQTRTDTLGATLGRLAPSGTAILDDAHWWRYNFYAKQIVRNHRMSCFNLRYFTHDKFGRYALLVLRSRQLRLIHEPPKQDQVRQSPG